MTVEELNDLVESAYEAAFAFEAQLVRIYLQAFDRAAREAANRFEAQTVAVTAAGFVAPVPDSLTSGMTEEEIASAMKVRQAAGEAVVAALAVLGAGAVGASLMAVLAQRGAQNFDLELLKILRATIERALREEWTVEQTATALRGLFANASPNTAQLLAQTELTTLANEESLKAAMNVGAERDAPLYKTWETRLDGRVRPAHLATQGQTVPVDQPFDVQGYSMMYPGDSAAPFRLVARCRCRMSYTDSLVASAKEVSLMTMTHPTTVANWVLEPDEEQMAATTAAAVTVTITDGEEDSVEEAAAEETAWKALLAIEGQPTEDGRLIEVGALTWRDLPLSLMAMDETGPGGHQGAAVAGRIDSIWRDGNEIWADGVFSNLEFGQRIASLVGEQSLRGNSVDLAVTKSEYRNAETGEVLDVEQVMDAYFNDIPVLFVVTEGVIMASTVCPTPAIAGAEIMLASGVIRMTFTFAERDALTASAAGLAPLHPPLDWYSNPGLTGPTALTVTKEGKVFGHAALWNSCHIAEPHGPGICVPPPRSGMQYEIFHHGVVETAEGVDVPCGQITMSTFHAGRDLSWKATQQHYEHSGIAVADVIAGEDAFGIWVSGGLRPDLPAERVRELKAGALSGDWRQVIGRGLEFLAALVVNIPGFPIPRPEARIVASALGEEEVLALVAAGMVTEEDVQGMTRREYLRKIESLTAE